MAFPRKWDPDGAFVRRYVPELARYDAKYIYEPWTAPLADQKKWGCLIRGDGSSHDDDDDNKEKNERVVDADGLKLYPKPMFDFPERRDFCIRAVKAAYATNLYGADPRVKDGSWKALFDDGDATDVGANNQSDVGEDVKKNDDDDGGDENVGFKEGGDGNSAAQKRKRGRGSETTKKGDGRQTTLKGAFEKMGKGESKKRRR